MPMLPFSFKFKSHAPCWRDLMKTRTEEELVVASSRPACLVSRNLSAKQTPSLDSGVSYSPGYLELGPQALGDQCGSSESSSGRPVRGVCERSSAERLVRGIENQLARTKQDYHKMQISDNQFLEKVFTNVRQKLNRLENEQIFDQKVIVLVWGVFMSSTMKAAVHLGQNLNDNLVTNRNSFQELKTLLDITQMLILYQDFDILNVSTIEWKFTPLLCYMTK